MFKEKLQPLYQLDRYSLNLILLLLMRLPLQSYHMGEIEDLTHLASIKIFIYNEI